MCGIAGILGPPADRTDELMDRMLATLEHRGPDGFGLAEGGPCRLGLRRLSIMGLTAQPGPFANEDGSILSVCNGEIYNSDELRSELAAEGHRFTTEVDTEVVPHLWEEAGVELVHRLDGMFAFAVWDRERQTLCLGRDRAGEKPLFYWWDGERLLFASELRALLAHPAVAARIEPRALAQYLTHGFFPAPLSPIAGVRKLPAGHLLVAREGRVELTRYWDLAEHFATPGSSDRRSTGEICAELDQRMSLACRRRSRSHVPFGVFLSGGIDSSALLAYLTEIHGAGVPAFTLGHTDRPFDESRFAAETARFFGADLHSLVVSRAELEEGLRAVGRGMDEPLGDASTIPTFLLSRFAREWVKVILSGEGADELFGGYPTYLGHRLAGRLGRIPAPLRHGLVGGAHKLLPVSMGNVGLDYLVQQFASGIDRPVAERHNVWFGSLDPRRVRELLAPRVLQALDPADVAAPFVPSRPSRPLPDTLAELLYTDFTLYLQDDLLTKVDRATMLASIEARAAFLDHELAEFVAGVPSRRKVRGWTTKAILRQTVRRRLPAAVLQRRKRGFNIPFSRWVLEGLGDELRRRFSRERVEARGLFSHPAIDGLIGEHMACRADHRKPLYALLAFDLWCDRTFGEGGRIPFGEEPSTAAELAPTETLA